VGGTAGVRNSGVYSSWGWIGWGVGGVSLVARWGFIDSGLGVGDETPKRMQSTARPHPPYISTPRPSHCRPPRHRAPQAAAAGGGQGGPPGRGGERRALHTEGAGAAAGWRRRCVRDDIRCGGVSQVLLSRYFFFMTAKTVPGNPPAACSYRLMLH
jgi:hypothetical protein